MKVKVGDVVRIGSGRAEYTVTWTDDKFPELRSENTGIVRRVSIKRLNIVERKDQ